MIFFLWIYLPILIRGVWCQCSGQTKTVSVGYSAKSVYSDNHDNGYPNGLSCSWLHLSALTGASLLVQINSTIDCPGDSISMYDGTSNTGVLLHSCTQTTPRYVVATSGKLYSYFTTDNNPTVAGHGFTFNVISARDFSQNACSTQQTLLASTSTSYISSPGFPQTYPTMTSCTWRIEKTGESTTLELTFIIVDVEYEQNGPCSFDYISITDDGTGITVLKTCGDDQWSPSKTYTTKNNVTVRFYSDASETGRGFLLAYFIQGSPSSDDTSSCYFNNCVVLPVMVAVGGVILIAIVTGVIICVVSKQYHKKGVSSSNNSIHPLRKKPSLRNIIIPKFLSKRHSQKLERNMFLSDNFIPSRPPMATVGKPKHQRHYNNEDTVDLTRNVKSMPRIPPILLRTIHETAKSKSLTNNTKTTRTRKSGEQRSKDKKRILESLNFNKNIVGKSSNHSYELRTATKEEKQKIPTQDVDNGLSVSMKTSKKHDGSSVIFSKTKAPPVTANSFE